ncbi:hypothetical protein VTO42DRAFT_3180 [Malbranchea cinnamomea]
MSSGNFKPPSAALARLFRLESATWLYPILGVIYFLTHPFLYPLFRSRLVPIVLLSAFIYTLLFFFTYIPQVAFLAIFQGWGAWVNGAILVLGEGAAIVALLFEAFFVDETQVDVFDAVFLREGGPGAEDLISHTRTLHMDSAQRDEQGRYVNPVKVLGKPNVSTVYAPFSLRQIIEFIVLLPLNLIPVAGPPLFLVLTGYRGGPFHHWRYFRLRDFSKEERKQYIERRQLRYTWFGTVALILQLVPMLSMLFLLTTAAGAALWAADMEKRRRAAYEYATQHGGQYHDNPV